MKLLSLHLTEQCLIQKKKKKNLIVLVTLLRNPASASQGRTTTLLGLCWGIASCPEVWGGDLHTCLGLLGGWSL